MRILVVTGGRRGPGRVRAGKLGHAGHHVVLAARAQAAAGAAEAHVRAHDPVAGVEPRPADLASLASIRTLAAALVDEICRLDVVFSIAGVLQARPSRRVTAG